MENLKIGIIGIGNMGSTHANNVYSGKIDNAELVAVCDIADEKREWAKENLKGVKIFEDYKELLNSDMVDAVIIATPHYLHPIIAMEAFEKGLNVLTEKPAGVYTEIVEKLNETSEKSGKVFGIMYNQRSDKIFSRAREIMQNGELGELKRVVWIITNWYRRQEYYNSGSWRATWAGEGGGVLSNQCPHNIDIMQWIVGMPVSVKADCGYGKFHNIEVEDDVTAYFEYPNGATGVFITSTGECPGTNRLEISCDKGKMVMENGKLCIWKHNIPEKEFRFFSTDEYKEKVKSEYSEYIPEKNDKSGHIIILQNFVNAVLFGEELIAPGYDGIKGLTISNSIHLSDWTGEKVVLPIDKKLYKSLLDERIKTSKPKETIVKDNSVKAGESSSRWEVKW